MVDFPAQNPLGRKQEGRRPAIVVALPNIAGATRYPLVVIVPTTTQQGDWVARNPTLYPRLQAGMGNLPRDSIVLIDQVRAVDIRRVLGYRGILPPEQYQPVEDGLRAMFRF